MHAVLNPNFAGRRPAAEVIESRHGSQVQQVKGIGNEQSFLDHSCPLAIGIGTMRFTLNDRFKDVYSGRLTVLSGICAEMCRSERDPHEIGRAHV